MVADLSSTSSTKTSIYHGMGTTVEIRIPISFISHHLLHGKDGEDGKDVKATSENLGG